MVYNIDYTHLLQTISCAGLPTFVTMITEAYQPIDASPFTLCNTLQSFVAFSKKLL